MNLKVKYFISFCKSKKRLSVRLSFFTPTLSFQNVFNETVSMIALLSLWFTCFKDVYIVSLFNSLKRVLMFNRIAKTQLLSYVNTVIPKCLDTSMQKLSLFLLCCMQFIITFLMQSMVCWWTYQIYKNFTLKCFILSSVRLIVHKKWNICTLLTVYLNLYF